MRPQADVPQHPHDDAGVMATHTEGRFHRSLSAAGAATLSILAWIAVYIMMGVLVLGALGVTAFIVAQYALDLV